MMLVVTSTNDLFLNNYENCDVDLTNGVYLKTIESSAFMYMYLMLDMTMWKKDNNLITISLDRKKSSLFWDPDSGPSLPFRTYTLLVSPLVSFPKD